MEIKTGMFVDFKLHTGRGRPMLGEVLQNKGLFVLVKSPVTRKEVLVPRGKILRERAVAPWWVRRAKDAA